MEKLTKYIAKKAGDNGYIAYTETEHATWQTLITRQLPVIEKRACQEFLDGLNILNFSQNQVPQLKDVNKNLKKATGWEVAAVPALISFDKFFDLLANCKFPAATFIRVPEELDYLKEPDIFHELFGHCPMLTNQIYADFTEHFGKLGVGASPKVQKFLARLYWFTIEFGLINTYNDLKIYGGGILSSIGETIYSLDSKIPERKPFDLLTALRTPYRIDIYQSIYFVINKFEDLFNIMNTNLIDMVHEAIQLGEFK
nr:phenylalanine 4-monooxygenase [Gammaproteobacteria bacterium]